MYYNTHLQHTKALHSLLQQHYFTAEQCIMPYSISQHEEGTTVGAYGVRIYSYETMLTEVRAYSSLGLRGVFLSMHSTEEHTTSTKGIVERAGAMAHAIRLLKKEFPHLLLFVDISTSIANTNNRFGIERNGSVNIDATMDILTEIAVVYAKAGVDVIVHSGMLHGLSSILKKVLYSHSIYGVAIASYLFQEKDIFCAFLRGNEDNAKGRLSHHAMPDKRYMATARNECKQGVDILLVNSTIAMDIVSQISTKAEVPILMFHSNTEYAVTSCAVANGIVQEDVFSTIYTSMMRAGATSIITPHTTTVLGMLHTVK